MPTTVITGASRGIGLEFVRQYLEDGWTVHAGARDPASAKGLRALACDRLCVHRLDVSRRDHIDELARALAGAPVDLLVNNAGMWIGADEQYGRFTDAAWMEQFRVHVFGPMAMAEALVDNLAASERKLIVNISSGNGSLGWDINVGDYPYNTTKAALNMISKSMSVDLAPRGIAVICFTPGYVATDMSGPDADLTPEQSVSAMRGIIAGLGIGRTGTFLRYNGESVPW